VKVPVLEAQCLCDNTLKAAVARLTRFLRGPKNFSIIYSDPGGWN